MTEMGSAKRVLIYRLGSLGDTLVALPALHLVATGVSECGAADADELSGECEGSGGGGDSGE